MKRHGFALSIIAAAFLLVGTRSSVSQEKLIYAFGPTVYDGDGPYAGLIFDSKGNLYGTTVTGGDNRAGAVFKLSPKANGWTETLLYSFLAGTTTDGSNPYGGLVFDAKGNLYGTTYNGGTSLSGTVFELSPEAGGIWSEKLIYSFSDLGPDGTYPRAGVIFDAKGNLYGTTTEGGPDNYGTVYELSPAAGGKWTEKVIYSFGTNPSDGHAPYASLLFDAKGNLYGTTYEGGSGGSAGIVFELIPAASGPWTEKILHNSGENSIDGNSPESGLIFDAKGNLYGTTTQGGAYSTKYAGGGTVFELSPASGGLWTEKILYSFGASSTDGQDPFSALYLDPTGHLFGTTQIGGTYGPGGNATGGTAYELTKAADGTWTEKILHNFGGASPDGALPYAALTPDPAGNLYGTTASGGDADHQGIIYEIPATTVAEPQFSPTPGVYLDGQKITITDATPAASIHYTTNGETPTSASAKYTEAIDLTESETIKAVALSTGLTESAVATAAYEVGERAATPKFSPGAGTYTAPQTVKITDATTGAVIYYTTNGTTPTTSSTKYSKPVVISTKTTLKAIANAAGHVESDVASETYTFAPPADKPVFSLAAGTYVGAQKLTLADETKGAVIYYTVDGTTPTAKSTKYSAAIVISTTETVKAIAIAPGFEPSLVHTAAYTIEQAAAKPVFSLAAGTYTKSQRLTMSDTTPGATIYYTTNGTPPTIQSRKYTGGILVDATETVEAFATAPGYGPSPIHSVTYTIQ